MGLDLVVGTLVGRWYVTLFGAVFLWRASRHMGWRNTGLYLVISVAVGSLAENLSVHTGLPYTTYSFNEGLRDDELFLGDVPLMVPLSYGFMAYFAFTAARLLTSGPYRTRAVHAWQELLMALVLSVWAIWILDPVSQRGGEFYLGDLFHYRGSGFWFGLPLGSQIGFTVTAGVLLAVLYALDRGARDVPVPGGLREHPHLVSLLTYHGQVFHLAAMAFWIGEDTLGAASIIVWVPVAVMTAVYWSSLRIRGS